MFLLNKSKFVITTSVLAFSLFFVLVLLFGVTAQVESYTLISPLPGIGESVSTSEAGGAVDYLNNIFVIFISIIAVLGVIKLMICGFQYMTSEAISSKEEAKKCMAGVFAGLFLVLLSVLILQTINPNLTQLSFFSKLEQSVEGKIPDAAQNGDDPDAQEEYCFSYICFGAGAPVTRERCFDSGDSCRDERVRRGQQGCTTSLGSDC